MTKEDRRCTTIYINYLLNLYINSHKVKAKVTLQRAMRAQTGSRSINSILSLTSALDGSVWSTPAPGGFIPIE
jgi:hypothetical protein